MWNLIRHHATKGRVIVLAVISLLSAMLLSHSYLLSRISSNNGKLGSRLGKNAETLSLHMSKVVEREIAEGQTHFFQITLDHNQYLALDFEQRGVRIEVSIYEPSGNLITRIRNRQNGPAPLSLIAQIPGNYRLNVFSLERSPIVGRYQITVKAIRQVAAKDKHRVAAERAFAEGDRLRREWKEESSLKAIGKYKEALASWRALDESERESLALKSIANIYLMLGQTQNALNKYNEALARSVAIHDRRSEAELYNDIGFVYISLNKNKEAQEYCQKALKLSRETGDQYTEAHVLNNIGEINYWLGELQQAISYYNQAFSKWQILNERRGLAQTLTYFGYTYSDLGETEKSFSFYKRALTLWRDIDDRQGEARTLTAIGTLNSKLGKKQEAINLYDQAGQLLKLMGDKYGEAMAMNGMGFVYQEMGEGESALKYYERALELYRAVGLRTGEAGHLRKIGEVQFSLGENQIAFEYFQQALQIYRDIRNNRLQSIVLRSIGRIHATRGDYRAALKEFSKALSIHRAVKDRRGEAHTHNYIGELYEGMGRRKQAIRHYHLALPLCQEIDDQVWESKTRYNIARAERGRGNLQVALSSVEKALKIAEKLRIDVVNHNLRTSYFSSIHQYYELYTDLFMLLDKRNPSNGYAVLALESSEKARARSFLELLAEGGANIHQNISSELLKREQELLQALNDKAKHRLQLSSANNERQVANVDKEIRELNNQYHEVRGQIKAQSPQYAALMQPQPLSLKEIQEQVLDNDTLLLECSLGDERSYLWAVTQTSISSHQLPKRGEIEKLARTVYDLLREPQPWGEEIYRQYWLKASELSEKILGPVAEQIGTKRLLIVADGALQYIPFGALPIPTPQGSSRAKNGNAADAPIPLVERHEIVTMPSASALAVLRREISQRKPAAKTVAVFADPVFGQDDARFIRANQPQQPAPAEQAQITALGQTLRDFDESGSGLPRLLSSIGEAEDILKLVPAKDRMMVMGFEANRAKVTSPELSNYRIIHFATHGLLNNEHPELSGIVLSLVDRQGQPQNGFLRLYDIYNLKLPAELVVLSACRTALGKEVKGEGLIGLTRGFMYAGAARVVSSLWKVDDEATAEFMKLFYRQMLERGHPPAFALTQAKREFRQQRRWNSPYYWAAFTIQGEWN